MKQAQILFAGFYIWWLFVNGCIYLAEFHFIRNFTGSREKKYMVPYVLLSDLLTLGMMYVQSPGVFRMILHMGMLLCFSRLLLKLRWRDTIAPAMIVLTLSSFMEGFQAIFMRWLVQKSIGGNMGMMLQMLTSGVLALCFILTLQVVSKKYADTGEQKIASYLYALLLPCGFIVWVIRSGLGLDMWMDQSFGGQSDLWALVWILGACAVFFIILRLVRRIITLSIQETEQKAFQDQMKKQHVYLEEAKKRNEQYRMFQHDINNHFLVLSGLLREKRFQEAEEYMGKLHRASDKLLVGIETGNPAVDILLSEKINFAKLNHIEMKQEVLISPDCTVEDMDLCILLANAMDNAIQACVGEDNAEPEISIALRQRHDFLIMEVVNTAAHGNDTVEYGTGLNNIKHVVEKYEGVMDIETGKNHFRLSVLLCLLPFTKPK